MIKDTWAKEILKSKSYEVKSEQEVICDTPWSRVSRFKTNKGYVYLKNTPPGLFIEADIINFLRNKSGVTQIPEVIASNKDLNCFLMRECGHISLRSYFNKKFNYLDNGKVLANGIKVYASIQKSTINHIDDLIKLGVPDWRLNKFTDLYDNLVKKEDLLIKHGLDNLEIKKLQKLTPKIKKICDNLSSIKIPECLDHCDFHDNNMLINTDNMQIAVIDLGEVVISHPLLSVAACLNNAVYRYNLDILSSEHNKLEQTCLSNYLDLCDNKKLLGEAFELAKQILPVYIALGLIRLQEDAHDEKFDMHPISGKT